MSNELTKSTNEIIQNPNKNDAGLIASAVGGAGTVLRLKMAANGNSAAVNDGVCKAGEYYLDDGETQTSIGADFEAIFYGYSPLAIDFSDDKNTVRSRDATSEIFKEIADRVNSQGINANAMYGVETVVGLRNKGSKGEDVVVTFFLNNGSMRRIAPRVMSFADDYCPVVVGSKLCENKAKNRWYAPTIREADIPFTLDISEDKINSALRMIYGENEETVSAPADERDV